MRFKDLEKFEKIYVLWRAYTPFQSASDPNSYQGKIEEYVRNPDKSTKNFIHVRLAHPELAQNDSDSWRGEGSWFGVHVILENSGCISRSEVAMRASVSGWLLLFVLKETMNDYHSDYYLCVSSELTAREFRRLERIV